MADVPTGTVTFLFTDLEGSTRLWEEHPDAMQAALARHDEILRDAIAAHDGYVVKMTGDGAHAAFTDARAAILTARAAQLTLDTESWGETGPLRVRMGIHTGPAEHRDGDYFGTAVNRAARLMSAAHGGQVIVSLTTEELVRDAGADIEFVDLGEHRLRDLSQPERIYQLVHVGLTRDFPALRSLDAYRSNLPFPSTSFVGRERELAAIASALESSRLVTITGVGGVGKTRLAIQVAAEIVPRVADGAWLAELAAASDEESFLQVVAAVVGAPQLPRLSLAHTLVEYLKPKQLLLVLDNCEHLLDPASGLADRILRDCRGVVLLATSREGLGVVGEQVWPLRSLPVPDVSADAAALAVNDAIRLFEERARAVKPAFLLEAGNARAVAEICRRLDGMPLAIELAAARVAVMNPDDIAKRLDERFRLLTGGRRTAVERHQTLRAAVDWSYSLLSPRDQKIFDRLGVFSGSFDADAVEAVVTDDEIDGWEALEALGGLVAKSMVGAEERSVGAARYQMLETLRQYARERLDESGEADHWRRRHAAHYEDVARMLGRELFTPDEPRWRARLAEERDNLRAAVLWGLDAESDDDALHALRLISELGYEASTDFGSGISAWADDALRRLDAAPSGVQRAVVATAAWSAYARGDVDAMRDLGERALQLGDAAHSPCPLLAHYTLASALIGLGDLPRCREIIEDGLRIAERLEDKRQLLALFAVLSSGAATAGEIDLARSTAAEAVRVARRNGSLSGLSGCLYILGQTNMRGDPVAARAALEEALALVEGGAGKNMALPSICALLAQLCTESGEVSRALGLLADAIVLTRDQLNRPAQTTVVQRSVPVFAALGHLETVALLGGALEGDRVIGGLAEFEREESRVLVEAARAQLADAKFATAHDRGASMPYDEVLDHVLIELDVLRKEQPDD